MTSTNEEVVITRKMFERIEEQTEICADTESKLSVAARRHKDAKADHESATATLNALVKEMIRVANGGQSDTPLFDNMNDHLERAEADPVSQALLKRLLDHAYSNLNLLIVHGYTEEERAELTFYLDSLDARDAAHAKHLEDDSVEVPAPLPEPAFISSQAIEERQASIDATVPTDTQVAEALEANDIQFMPWHADLSPEQRRVVIAWAAAADRIRAEKAEALVYDDLPTPPSFVLNPEEVTPDTPAKATAGKAATKRTRKAGAIKERGHGRVSRGSTKPFNTPRKVRAAVGKKGARS